LKIIGSRPGPHIYKKKKKKKRNKNQSYNLPANPSFSSSLHNPQAKAHSAAPHDANAHRPQRCTPRYVLYFSRSLIFFFSSFLFLFYSDPLIEVIVLLPSVAQCPLPDRERSLWVSLFQRTMKSTGDSPKRFEDLKILCGFYVILL
jgi:hypothetical protein